MITRIEKRIPPRWRPAFRRAYYFPWMAAYAAMGRRRIPTPPDAQRAVGDGDFHEIGEAFARHAIRLCALGPESRVLDIGCGLGRVAIPLTRILRGRGFYEGFDVEPARVHWCQNRISRLYPRFHFQRLDVRNGLYNATGATAAAAARFPYPDGSFDVALAVSVFTHMLPDGVDRYLAETARVLRPGGRCLATFFLLDAATEALLSSGAGAMAFSHGDGDCRLAAADRPEAAVAHAEARLRETIRRRGLLIREPIVRGSWPGRERVADFQDIVILERPADAVHQPPAIEERIHPRTTANRENVRWHIARYR